MPAEKALVIEKLRQEFKLELLLDTAKLPRVTFYYHLKRQRKQYRRMLKAKGIRQSMSRKATVWTTP